MIDLSGAGLWPLLRHAGAWLANLSRAGARRKQASDKALRRVVVAARETAVYIRQLQDTQQRCHGTEARLSVLWTELGFELKDLGLNALAKRCQISGKHWSNPRHYDDDFLCRADVSLERMESLASQILAQLDA